MSDSEARKTATITLTVPYVDDSEIQALSFIAAAMGAVRDVEARSRIADWAQSRWGQRHVEEKKD